MMSFNAARARQLVEDQYAAQGRYLDSHIERCLEDVERLAGLGYTHMLFYKTDNMIVYRLQELGFGVQFIASDSEGDHLRITW